MIAVNGKIAVAARGVGDTAMIVIPAAMISPAQIRAARALIGWKQSDLAVAAAVAEASVKNIERGTTDPRVKTLQAIQRALESAGVLFLDEGVNREGGAGVRLK